MSAAIQARVSCRALSAKKRLRQRMRPVAEHAVLHLRGAQAKNGLQCLGVNRCSVHGHFQVAAFKQAGRLHTRPVGHHAGSFDQAAGGQDAAALTVVCAGGAVFCGGAAELGDREHQAVVPTRTHALAK